MSFGSIKVNWVSDNLSTPEVESLSKLEISFTSEVAERLDEVVELLGYGSGEELVRCVMRRFLDRCHLPRIGAR